MRRTMKKAVAVGLAAATAFSLCACGGGDGITVNTATFFLLQMYFVAPFCQFCFILFPTEFVHLAKYLHTTD